MYIETLRLENESLHLELMRREHKRSSSLSIKAQEFRPRFRFSIKAKEFVPVSKTVGDVLKDNSEEGMKKEISNDEFQEELKEELNEKCKELEQLLDPLSANAKVFVPNSCLYRCF